MEKMNRKQNKLKAPNDEDLVWTELLQASYQLQMVQYLVDFKLLSNFPKTQLSSPFNALMFKFANVSKQSGFAIKEKHLLQHPSNCF